MDEFIGVDCKTADRKRFLNNKRIGEREKWKARVSGAGVTVDGSQHIIENDPLDG